MPASSLIMHFPFPVYLPVPLSHPCYHKHLLTALRLHLSLIPIRSTVDRETCSLLTPCETLLSFPSLAQHLASLFVEGVPCRAALIFSDYCTYIPKPQTTFVSGSRAQHPNASTSPSNSISSFLHCRN